MREHIDTDERLVDVSVCRLGPSRTGARGLFAWSDALRRLSDIVGGRQAHCADCRCPRDAVRCAAGQAPGANGARGERRVWGGEPAARFAKHVSSRAPPVVGAFAVPGFWTSATHRSSSTRRRRCLRAARREAKCVHVSEIVPVPLRCGETAAARRRPAACGSSVDASIIARTLPTSARRRTGSVCTAVVVLRSNNSR